jgi:hypothetical protein
MGTAFDYTLEVAPADVRATLDWMTEVGFYIRTERGGRDESFGNVLLDFERPPTAIRLIRDRGQWTLGLALDGRHFVGLQVLLNARDGGEFLTPDHDPVAPLPEVLPEGGSWASAVPEVLAWLAERDRSEEIECAQVRGRAAVQAWLDRRRGDARPG